MNHAARAITRFFTAPRRNAVRSIVSRPGYFFSLFIMSSSRRSRERPRSSRDPVCSSFTVSLLNPLKENREVLVYTFRHGNDFQHVQHDIGDVQIQSQFFSCLYSDREILLHEAQRKPA